MIEPSNQEWANARGWRFIAPFRCMKCGKRISLEQFCFSGLCGACDCGREPSDPINKRLIWCAHRRLYSGPRTLIDSGDEYFLPQDRWANPPEGLDMSKLCPNETAEFEAQQAMWERISKGQ